MTDRGVNETYRIPDLVWEQIKPLLPPELSGLNGDPPRMDNQRAMEAILYVLHTGCKWKDIPPSMGAANIVHERYKKWRKAGVFQRIWRTDILKYDEFRTLFWYDKPWMRR